MARLSILQSLEPGKIVALPSLWPFHCQSPWPGGDDLTADENWGLYLTMEKHPGAEIEYSRTTKGKRATAAQLIGHIYRAKLEEEALRAAIADNGNYLVLENSPDRVVTCMWWAQQYCFQKWDLQTVRFQGENPYWAIVHEWYTDLWSRRGELPLDPPMTQLEVDMDPHEPGRRWGEQIKRIVNAAIDSLLEDVYRLLREQPAQGVGTSKPVLSYPTTDGHIQRLAKTIADQNGLTLITA